MKDWLRGFSYWLAALTILLLMLWGANAAFAHTPAQQDDWTEAWIERVQENNGLSIELIGEWLEFRDRHTPPPPATFTYQGMGSNVAQWLPLVETHFAPTNVPTMMCLMGYESGGNPDAKNPNSSARGLFQVMASIWAPAFNVTYDALYDPETNVRIASRIYDIQGYRAWAPYNRGLCRGL